MQGLGYAIDLDHAPAPEELIEALQEVEVETSIEVASIFRLRIGIAQTATGWSVLDDDLFTPLLPVTIRLTGGPTPAQTLINGYVANQVVTYSEQPGQSVLEVTGLDATMLMNLEEKVTSWPNQADSAIASAVFGTYQLTPRVRQTSPVISDPEGTIVQRATDIRFLRHLASRNGFDCYVQADPLTGLDQGWFQPRQLSGRPQAVLSIAAGEETNVTDLSVRYELARPTSAEASGVDVPSKSAQPVSVTSASDQALGATAVLDRVSPTPRVRLAATGLVHSGDLQTAAQAVVNSSSWAVVAEGRTGSDVALLLAGDLVTLRNLGDLLSGTHLLTMVSHVLGKEGWVQRFRGVRNAVGLSGSEQFAEAG